MKVWLRIGLVVALLGMAASALMLRVLRKERGSGAAAPVVGVVSPSQPDPGWEGVTVPPFRLTDQTGAAIDETILDGRVTIVDFFFTHCPFVCPGMNGAMAQLADELKGEAVQFLGVSVDPEHDTVERLREYAAGFEAQAPRWRMATGDREQVWALIRDSLKFEVSEETENKIALQGGATMSNILHPSHLILVGPGREVLGIYLFSREEQLQALRVRARALARGLK